MKVKEVMTQEAVCCAPETNVGTAVELMWIHNCGMLPVVKQDGKVVGVVTDRDICIALGTRNRLAGDITVGEIATKNAITCKMDDEIHEALSTMASRQVRRLPVVNKDGVAQGILSMDDVVTHGDLKKWEGGCELSSEEIIRSLKKLYRRQFPMVQKAAAA